jgi:hypothetical protein
MGYSDLNKEPIDRQSRWVLLIGALLGAACFGYYYTHNLTTAHYDAKAHLVVARRIVDSIDPGYDQIGASWLPLLHLIYLPFVLLESQYRTGFLPSLISVCAFALSGWLIFRIAYRATNSKEAALFAAIMLLANANLQYLQSCPLTEPVYLALMLLAFDNFLKWRDEQIPWTLWMAAIWAGLAALCRYEGWAFVAGVILILVFDFLGKRITLRSTLWAAAIFGAIFILFVGSHFGYIYFSLRDSLIQKVVQGHPAPSETYRRPLMSLVYHLGELWQIAGSIPLLISLGVLVYFLFHREKWARQAPLLLLWFPSIVNVSALFWGMIYRVRYSVLLLPAIAIFAALPICRVKVEKRLLFSGTLAAFVLPWFSFLMHDTWRYGTFHPGPGIMILPLSALLIFLLAVSKGWYRWPLLALCVLGMQVPVLLGEYRAILNETLEHGFIESEKGKILDYLRKNYDGTPVMIDMGKLAPLIYDSELPIKKFVYNEGINVHWQSALKDPLREVGWLCALKGDDVWERLRVDPSWADGYSLAVKTENFMLYRLKIKVRD